MKFLTTFAIIASAQLLQAQTIDSIDNIILKVPVGWEMVRQPSYLQLTSFNKTQNSFCHLAIYRKQPASTDRYASFQREWRELVPLAFETTAVPSPLARTTSNTNVLYFGTKATNKTNNLPYYIELHVFDCGNTVQSILLTSGSKQHLQSFDSSWQRLLTTVRKNNLQQPAVSASSARPFKGLWSKSSSSPMGLDPGSVITHVGYIKCQYDFKDNGTYTLRGESGGGALRSDNFALIDESGSFTVTGSQLLLIPSKSKLTITDKNGNVQKTQKLDADKRTYTWQLYFFEGLNETQLVLTPLKEYFQDGGLASGSMFPNAYLYSQDYKPEWRIQPK